jgi:hypothetical protein
MYDFRELTFANDSARAKNPAPALETEEAIRLDPMAAAARGA